MGIVNEFYLFLSGTFNGKSLGKVEMVSKDLWEFYTSLPQYKELRFT